MKYSLSSPACACGACSWPGSNAFRPTKSKSPRISVLLPILWGSNWAVLEIRFANMTAILLAHRRNLNEFLRFEYAARKTCLTYGALKIVHAVDSNAYRTVAFTLGCEVDRGLSLEY